MIKQYFLFFACLMALHQVQSQTILVLDGIEPVVNASVRVLDVKNGIEAFYTSNDLGRVDISQSPPFQIVIDHLNFETRRDTIREIGTQRVVLVKKEQTLDEVIITGQFLPQSVKQSVYKVRVVDQKRLAAQGVQSLSEALAYELNFQFQRDNAVGSSSVNLQGISGQNIKVLLDGVPISGRSGINNEIDLAQINLSTVEKIEIVEGPMAVSYGADALAGVVNIITKTPNASKWSADLILQEESIGDDYSLLSEGIHNLSLSGSYSLSSYWSIQSATRLYKFGGWGGSGRDKLWYPKSQFFQSGVLSFGRNNFSFRYRLDYLNETLENLGLPEPTSDQNDPFAFDKEYLTKRQMHQIQVDYQLPKGSLSNVISYTDYDRVTHRFKSYLIDGVPDATTVSGQDSISFKTIFFRNTLNDVIQWSIGPVRWHTQLGIDGTFENGEGTTLSTGDKQITNVGFFSSLEMAIGDNLKVRPGLRYAYNNTFSTAPSASINLKYDLNVHTQIRLSYGRGFRTPSLRELYHEFIDANHNILGNPNLEPEYSNNINGDFTHQFKDKRWSLMVSGFYNSIYNRISFFTPESGNQITSYLNVRNFKTLGTTGQITYESKQLSAKTGFSYVGRYHNFSENASNLDVPKFLYSPELTANLNWVLFNTGITLASFYKYTGPAKQYINQAQEGNSSGVVLRQLNGYHLWDLTLTKTFVKVLTTSLGAKNLLDVTSVSNTVNSGGAHSGNGDGQSSIAYGRSFFIKLNYNFSK